jgi:hypothetical protein
MYICVTFELAESAVAAVLVTAVLLLLLPPYIAYHLQLDQRGISLFRAIGDAS